MKKILTIALVALLAASTAFAGISGSATVKLGYDTTSKVYGMSNTPSVTANIELDSAEVENVAEGDVYAGIKASMKLAVIKDNERKGTAIWVDGGSKQGLGLWLAVEEAYVAGADWKLSILEGKGAPDYAKSAIDGEWAQNKDDFGGKIPNSYYWKDTTYKMSAWNGAGVALTYKGYTVAGGFAGGNGKTTEHTTWGWDYNDESGIGVYKILETSTIEYPKYFAFNVFAETKAFEFEGGSAQAAVIVARDGHTDDYDEYDSLDKTNLGFSAKANYAVDAFSACVASDFGIENLKEAEVNFDVAAKVAYDFVALDAYYLHGNKLLSAKVSAELEAVSPYAQIQDILNEDGRYVEAGAEATLDALTLSGSVGMTLKAKEFSTSVNAEYVAEKFTLKGGVDYGTTFGTEKSSFLSATASVSSDVVIPGATLSLAYGKDSAGNKMNFLKDQTNSGDYAKQNFGAITASCKIAF